MSKQEDEAIDELYRGSLNDFTAARNALVKNARGADASRLRKLAKPTVTAWAANQLYWRARQVYERLIKSGEHLRKAQIAALEGKVGRAADIREATDAHRRSIADAVKQAEAIASAAGARPSPDALMRTFEALSLAAEPPEASGRLTKELQPAGFEALTGVRPVSDGAPKRGALHSVARPSQGGDDHDVARPVQGREDRDVARPFQGREDRRAVKARNREEAAEAKRRAAEEKQRATEIRKAEAVVERAQAAEALAREALERAQRDVRDAQKRLERLKE